MKKSRIYILFFSLSFGLSFTQQKLDSNLVKSTYQPNFMIGIDMLNLGTSLFSERKVYQGFISSEIKKNIHAIAEAGFEKNNYQKNNYDAIANGIFLKIGTTYMLAQDRENRFNGFYAGIKIGGSYYAQEYFAVPIRGFERGDYTDAFPKTSQMSFWLEGTIGGRVQLFDSNFYIDVNTQPRYMVYTSKQDDIYPMIVPGFGKSSTKFNLGFAWNIIYKF